MTTRRTLMFTAVVLAAALVGCARQSVDEAAGHQPAELDTVDHETADHAPAAEPSSRRARPTGEIDRLVPVGPGVARMHLTCTGEGSSTVLLLAGFGDAGDSWGAITPELRDRARVCLASRLGTGTSDTPPSDQTFATQAADLHHALDAAGERGPYVVAGHSFGGDEAVLFASRFPDDVAGLLLIDASPPAWPDAVCSVPDDGSETARGFRDTCATIAAASGNPERLDGRRAFSEAAAIGTLGDLPMRVLTRAEVSYPGLAVEPARRLAETWHDGQVHWVSLSSASRLVEVPASGHHIQVDRPGIVVEHLRALLR
ncbi:alpha/beta fold hydrolase [Dermatobacter hominis]|uniref:alpha/beta fold hydrolase n=1 Tax=Dermatobacter hominis TaxID=2884263 RepID=UPI001D0FCEAF|nr:alpha/beta hydrolase [Dermatobacter hominis]UDY37588.1 alpha/beta hydrolase [Dermatobacter hominis]